jgi:membrane fusion protein, multidrug efflux system
MIRLSFALALAGSVALAGCQGPADAGTGHDVASAAVRVSPAAQGSLLRTVVAWGEVSPGAAFQQVVSVGVDGSLARLKVGQGERVSAGQVLATFAYAPAGRAALVQAQSAVDVAGATLDRVRRLRGDALATAEQVVQAEKALADARATLAVFPHGAAPGQPVLLRAPVAGTVAGVAAAVGQVVPANSALITLTPTRALTVVAGAEPSDASSLRGGMAATLTPANGGQVVRAHVLAVGDAVDAQTRLVPVRIQPDGELMAGSTWRADIALGEVTGWLAPSDAVIGEGASTGVFQVHEGKAHRVPVRVLIERDGRVVLQGRLDASDPVVTEGAPQLAEGSVVVINGRMR